MRSWWCCRSAASIVVCRYPSPPGSSPVPGLAAPSRGVAPAGSTGDRVPDGRAALPACGKRTRADLPAGVPRRPFGVRLTAVIALLSGRYRLSRREVRQLLRDLWQVRVSLGAVVRQEQAQSAALAPVVGEARSAVQQ